MEPLCEAARPPVMRRLNYVFSILAVVLGVLFILFMLTQSVAWNIGTAIGVVLFTIDMLGVFKHLWLARKMPAASKPQATP